MLTKISWPLSLIIILVLALAACSAAPETTEPIPEEANLASVGDVVAEPADTAEIVVESAVVPAPLPEVEAEIETEDTATEDVATKDVVVETAVLPASSSTTLTDAEIEALQFMREEEKLARDLYLALYDQWGLPIFQNIAGSEQAHIDTVLGLMQRFDVADTAADLGPGQFANDDLQALYDQLLANGSQSQADALRVGALVEETDIADLESYLATIQNTEISQALNNLLQGSFNHLRSYASMIERQTGEVYQPQVLEADAYADILAGTSNGSSSGQMQGQGQGQSQGNGRGNGQGNGGGNGRS